MSCIRCLITGRVQGVFYRASSQEKARSLGLTGWAKNLPDGRVEVLACGEDRQLKELESWLWQGPNHASVGEVVTEIIESDEQLDGFGIRY
jgi:acylphosphatase